MCSQSSLFPIPVCPVYNSKDFPSLTPSVLQSPFFLALLCCSCFPSLCSCSVCFFLSALESSRCLGTFSLSYHNKNLVPNLEAVILVFFFLKRHHRFTALNKYNQDGEQNSSDQGQRLLVGHMSQLTLSLQV